MSDAQMNLVDAPQAIREYGSIWHICCSTGFREELMVANAAKTRSAEVCMRTMAETYAEEDLLRLES